MKTIISLLSFAFCLLSFPAWTQIIHVPADYPTIQQGINAANSWFDTVLVAPGTYYENINFKGKQITVASNYCLSGDTNDIINTIIDGSQPVNPDMASVVTFNSYEDTNSVIYGFTITGGTGSIVQAGIRAGGGINIVSSGAKIIHNYIENNVTSGDDLALGGGISHGPPFDFNYLVIKNNRVCDNEAIGTKEAAGGGIGTNGNVIICNNLISNNTCKNLQQQGDKLYSLGGGMYISCAIGEERKIFITDNVISNNHALSESIYDWNYTGGGGVRLQRTYGDFTNNKILGNVISSTYRLAGCGLFVAIVDTSLTINANTIAYNVFTGEGECKGGGVFLDQGNSKFINNMIYRNHADQGGGFHFWNESGTTGNSQIINNTITLNEADEGGAIFSNNTTPYVFNSILWDNESNTGVEISGDCEVRYSCVDGGYPGVGNIDEDPDFIDPDNDDFHIPEDSPCAKMGTEEIKINGTWLYCPEFDFEGDPRPWANGSSPDIGADEVYNPPNGISSPEYNEDIDIQVFPNPLTSSTALSYNLDKPSIVTIRIFNSQGHIVEMIELEQPKGEQQVQWNAEGLPAGLYFFRIQAGDMVGGGKMVKMR